MKKTIAVVMCLIVVSLVGCGTTMNIGENNVSSELSPKEKYDKAVVLIEDKKYEEAIEILETIDYEDSKELKKQTAYNYARELFNQQEFETAYDYFVKAEDYLDAKKNINKSAYFAGVKLVNTDMHWKSIDWFRIALNDQEFKNLAEKHIIKITTSLIGNAWFGSYTNSKGTTLQIEFKYFEGKNNLYIAHADKNNGYKQVASINGSLTVGAETCKYYHSETTFGGSWDAVEFSFSSSNRMYVYCNAKSIGEAITGYYTAKNTPSVYYKIDKENYPTITTSTIDSNDNGSSNTTSTNTSSNTTSTDTSSNTTSTDTNSNNNSSNEVTSNKGNANINSTPNNTNTNTSSNQSTSHTHSYSKATCTKPETCSCGATTGSALGHNISTDGKRCLICNAVNPNIPKPSDFYVVYNSKISTCDNCIVDIGGYRFEDLDEYFSNYDGNGPWFIFSITIKSIGKPENFYSPTASVRIKFYDANNNILNESTPMLKMPFGKEVGYTTELQAEIPGGTKKIVICDYSAD